MPKVIIDVEAETIVVVSVVITNTPMVHKLEKNPLEVIETGDFVVVDADSGIVEVVKRRGKR